MRRLKRQLSEKGMAEAGRDSGKREVVTALFDEFVRDTAVRVVLARIPWGGFREKVLGVL